MNYRYGLLAVVLAVSSFAAPTLALSFATVRPSRVSTGGQLLKKCAKSIWLN